jgi:hypothetical protein
MLDWQDFWSGLAMYGLGMVLQKNSTFATADLPM